MKSMDPGVLIKRRDNTPFPDNHFWAIVREPEKKNDPFGRIWIHGGQWVPKAEVDFVPMKDVIEQAWGASEELPPVVASSAVISGLERQYQAELERRRRAEKRAAKANSEIEPMHAAVRKAEKEAANLRTRLGFRQFNEHHDKLNAAKLDLIKQIVEDRMLYAD